MNLGSSLGSSTIEARTTSSRGSVTDEQLLYLNQEGIIPGPSETADAFLERANACLNLSSTITNQLKEHLPFGEGDIAHREALQNAKQRAHKVYGIKPDWVPLFYSNHQLSPWQGGCAWIFQLETSSAPMAFFQLRKQFANRPTYLGIYHRDELLVHEFSHVGRMAFEEPEFEELLAYQSSDTWFRRWFGPILRSSREAAIFLISLLAILFLDIALISQHETALYQQTMWFKLIPLGLVAYALYRLAKSHWRFNNCFSHLREIFRCETTAHAVIFRLTDKEIERFSRQCSQAILAYAKEQSRCELRWRLMMLAYFSKITPASSSD